MASRCSALRSSPAEAAAPSRACTFFFSSRRRHTRCGRDWSSDCALPISSPFRARHTAEFPDALSWFALFGSYGRPWANSRGTNFWGNFGKSIEKLSEVGESVKPEEVYGPGAVGANFKGKSINTEKDSAAWISIYNNVDSIIYKGTKQMYKEFDYQKATEITIEEFERYRGRANPTSIKKGVTFW